MAGFTESVVEDAALAWLETLGYAVKHGLDISPPGDALSLTLSQGEREDYRDVVLDRRHRTAVRANFSRAHALVAKNAITRLRGIFRKCILVIRKSQPFLNGK